MASTNKTTNYDLSQYTANDKPTYLVDYNSDMNKIDNQMKANSDLAGLAKTEADDLSSRVDGQDIIIGTLNTTVGQHTTDIRTLNTNVSNLNTKVGDLTNLNTTDKTDVVSAVNEVNTKVGDLSNLVTTDKTNIVSAINEIKNEISNYLCVGLSTDQTLNNSNSDVIYKTTKLSKGNLFTLRNDGSILVTEDCDISLTCVTRFGYTEPAQKKIEVYINNDLVMESSQQLATAVTETISELLLHLTANDVIKINYTILGNIPSFGTINRLSYLTLKEL